jgi:hypothetical protein
VTLGSRTASLHAALTPAAAAAQATTCVPQKLTLRLGGTRKETRPDDARRTTLTTAQRETQNLRRSGVSRRGHYTVITNAVGWPWRRAETAGPAPRLEPGVVRKARREPNPDRRLRGPRPHWPKPGATRDTSLALRPVRRGGRVGGGADHADDRMFGSETDREYDTPTVSVYSYSRTSYGCISLLTPLHPLRSLCCVYGTLDRLSV